MLKKIFIYFFWYKKQQGIQFQKQYFRSLPIFKTINN